MIPRWTRRRVALAIAIAALGACMIYMTVTGTLTARGVKDWLDSLGPWAPALFVGAFVAGSLVGLPGMAFVAGARLAFGPWLGFALAYGGGVLAVTVPFVGARALRRADVPPWRPSGKRLGRLFAQLEAHPLAVVIALRLILWFNAALTYALALSPIRTRHYVLGCAIALAPVVALATFVSGWFA
ncbi:MAG: TVP38/TMEM64 family protein [Myxococcales bacterium]|nr:TVP38/TMEM64 family protein [Myxococcales bacterium]